MSALSPEQRVAWLGAMATRAMIAAAVCGFACVVQGIALYMLITRLPEARYVSLTADKRIVPMTPTSSPIADASVLNWTAESLILLNTLTYVDAQKRVGHDFRPRFTERGWQAWIKENRENLRTIVDRQYIVSAALQEPPAIVDRGVKSGIYYWVVRAKVMVKYDRAGQTPITQPLTADLIVARQFEDIEASGLGISSLVTRQAGGL